MVDNQAVTASPQDNALARVIAFYLPQYHPIPENDAWNISVSTNRRSAKERTAIGK